MENTENSQKSDSSSLEETSADALEKPDQPVAGSAQPDDIVSTTRKKGGIKGFIARFNIYLSMFILIVLVASIIVTIAFYQSKKGSSSIVKTEGLSQSTLQQLANSDATVGGPTNVLNVESNAVFAGKVLVKDNVDIAGGLQVSGTVGFGALTITGDSNLNQVNVAKGLNVGGNLAVQGTGTFNSGIQVAGSGTFSGPITTPQITTPNFQLNGNLTITHHFIVGGPRPQTSPGNALGVGGTASIGGSDTAGDVTINIGGGPTAGCFITVQFSTPYSQTPYVIVSPVGASAAGISYYINKTDSTFSICTTTAAPANSSFDFDYFVAS